MNRVARARAVMRAMLVLASGCGSKETPAPAMSPPAATSPAVVTARPDAAVVDAAPAKELVCPSSVDGASTRVIDGAGDVEVVITATDPAAVATIRSLVEDRAMFNCQVAMEPPGWMTDDCFNDDPQGGGRRCPIMARTPQTTVENVDGGVRIAMRPLGRSPEGATLTLAQLRAEIHRRAAGYNALHLPSSGPFSLPADWLVCKTDHDCTIVGLGCCDLTAVAVAHATDASEALGASGRRFCPIKSACVSPTATCDHSVCTAHMP